MVGHARLLQEVSLNVTASHSSHVVEPDANELAEPGGVVVPHGLGVAVRLQHGVGLDDLVLKGGFALLPLARGADGGEVGYDLVEIIVWRYSLELLWIAMRQ